MAAADSLNVISGTSSVQAWQTPTQNNLLPGRAYWNNWSLDDNHSCNIGFWLSGQGGCQAHSGQFYTDSPNTTASFLGDSSTRWSVTKAANTSSVSVTTAMTVTAWDTQDEFGWFSLDNPTVLNALFKGVTLLDNTTTFMPSGNYGFYIKSPGGTYLSTGTGDSKSHFTIFDLGSGNYVIGAEDMFGVSDWDYNDLIFSIKVNTTETPEPASMILLGTGLVGLGAAARRRRQAK